MGSPGPENLPDGPFVAEITSIYLAERGNHPSDGGKLVENNMIAQISSLPGLYRSEFDRLDATVRTSLNHDELLATKQLLITGCGDSYMAGLAAEMAFSSLTGLRVDVAKAMQAARYSLIDQTSSFPSNPLTVTISVSGEVARTIEAATVAQEKGALVLAITANPGSRLGQMSDRVIDCTFPPVPDAPGVLSYHVSLLALYLLAIRFAEVKGRISQVEGSALRRELKNLADLMEESIAALKESARALASVLKAHKNFVFVSHGPNFATALFSAAKIVEAAGCHAVGQDTEEWAHFEYFTDVDASTPTFVISPHGRGHSRANELIAAMNRVGRTTVAVVPQNDCAILPSATYALPIAGSVREMFSPMVYAVAGELFSAYHYEEVGAVPFRQQNSRYEAGGNTIRSSQVLGVGDLS